MRTYSTINALIKYKDKYLVLQRANNRTNPGYWNCITGHIKDRECAEDAALREVKEETNLEGNISKVALPYWVDAKDVRWVTMTYLVEVDDITNLKIDENESQDYKWIYLDDDIVKQSRGLQDVIRVLKIGKIKDSS
jgi:8-oxo-dGTP pyrophosphatase MutT (NUDIX family)